MTTREALRDLVEFLLGFALGSLIAATMILIVVMILKA